MSVKKLNESNNYYDTIQIGIDIALGHSDGFDLKTIKHYVNQFTKKLESMGVPVLGTNVEFNNDLGYTDDQIEDILYKVETEM